MVALCANPLYGALFRYFREGKLFLVDASRSMLNVPGESLLTEPSESLNISGSAGDVAPRCQSI